MPVTLPALSRRRWLQGSLAALLAPHVHAQEGDAETWILFSDTHIHADPAHEARGVNLTENLKRCVNQALKSRQKPYGVLVNGDIAFNKGLAGDYETFASCVAPLREAGVAVHCGLGNHDDRDTFLAAFTNPDEPRPVEGRHVTVIRSARVNWVLLDSLDRVNSTPGVLGSAQISWLDRTLAKLPERPTFVLAHHNPQGPVDDGHKANGLTDSDALFEVLRRHDKVRAYIYGHTHNWGHNKDERGLHLINLPPTAYTFDATRPNGWVVARAHADRMEFELRALNPAHDQHAQKVVVPYGA
jgi:Icc protein